jgi:methylenetetrahydrofolate dehydrogenase (NADP+) / methenyltetrahydrofolate cyclohydrolase
LSTIILNGKEVSDKIKLLIFTELENLKLRKPKLVSVIIGNDPDADVYVRNKSRACEKLGILYEKYNFDENIKETDLIKAIDSLNNNPEIDGIIIEMPLPKNIDANKLTSLIEPSKDVDCMNPINLGKLLIGNPVFIPSTVLSIMTILEAYKIDLEGKNVVVIGRSNIVGKPVILTLLSKNATVTACHSKTRNLKDISKQADILIVAIGKPQEIDSNYVKEGAVVIDVGVNSIGDTIVGDVDFDNVKNIASYITPVPGGIGILTTTMLLSNTLKAYKLHI